MSERVLTTRELNRALLARQLLLRRRRLSAPRAIERVGALQAQWPPSPYIALWSRLEGFRRERLMREVEARRVVKSTLMRETLHLVSSADYLGYGGLFTRARAARIERELAKAPGDADLDELTRELVRHTSESPRSRPELLALLGRPRLTSTERRPWLEWHMLTARGGPDRRQQVRPRLDLARRRRPRRRGGCDPPRQPLPLGVRPGDPPGRRTVDGARRGHSRTGLLGARVADLPRRARAAAVRRSARAASVCHDRGAGALPT
ncbi:MAG: winged helix DNA-binding domain-containing protein [Actinobacteria bacterium]|nr:MAG: winged helix DNA-binding domain-containing protein [Actinomycetota bacterium]